jgi:hypothetical protein
MAERFDASLEACRRSATSAGSDGGGGSVSGGGGSHGIMLIRKPLQHLVGLTAQILRNKEGKATAADCANVVKVLVTAVLAIDTSDNIQNREEYLRTVERFAIPSITNFKAMLPPGSAAALYANFFFFFSFFL